MAHLPSHRALAGLLVTGALAVGGLTVASLFHFHKPAGAKPPDKIADQTKSAPAPSGSARYQIEKVDEICQMVEGAGKLGFFGQPPVLEAWVFKYQGGYLQCHLETDVDGRTEAGDVLPNNWSALLNQDEGLKDNKAVSFEKQGYVILTAIPTTVSLTEALGTYHLPFTGMLAGAPFGPFHALLPLQMEVTHRRPYRLYLSANPMPTKLGTGFNLWSENELPIRASIMPRPLSEDEVHVGGGKDLKPGQDILLLDRQRGSSRVRLKARFLGDGEVRNLATK